MKRQTLTNNPRQWFDLGRARKFPDRVRFVSAFGAWKSLATGDFYAREDLYLSASGRWIVHWWTVKQGYAPLWVEIPTPEALAWLERVGYQEASAAIRAALARYARRAGIVYEAVPAAERR